MNSETVEASLISIGQNPNIFSQAVILAYTGWGYNFYSLTNKLQADDQLIRVKISALLSRVAADLLQAGSKLAACIPPATRQDPMPGRDTMVVVVLLRRIAGEIDATSTKITSLTTPGRDKIWDRHRNRRDTLQRLQGYDLYLGQLAFDLQSLVEASLPLSVSDAAKLDDVEQKHALIVGALRAREDMLKIGG